MAVGWVECVPNFSEGRDRATIDAIVGVARAIEGVHVLDLHVDPNHNRSVLTFAGPAGRVAEAAYRTVEVAAARIDLDKHRGVHPRVGAADVVPFVPLGGTTMAECVELARQLGARIGRELGVPVFLYGAAASRLDRRRPADFRRGGYERLKELVGRDPDWTPDFGPARLGSAGATLVGARGALIAFNVNLATADVEVARAVARAVRESSGGLPSVQALGVYLAEQGIAQVTTNLLDYRMTPLHVLFDAVKREAAARGVQVLESELVGLVPTEALVQLAAARLKVQGLKADIALEANLVAKLLVSHDKQKG